LLQLRAHPLCAFCLASGELVPARVADHIVKHNGDARLFYENELQSLCWNCHERRKKSIETLGYDKTIGVDGWPVDPLHPSRSGALLPWRKPSPASGRRARR
jgi:5-methylcytosine-specific restriction protein A